MLLLLSYVFLVHDFGALRFTAPASAESGVGT
jgi:hypothetical protein